jgi:L-ascorbate 6-phosphate lactonase
MKNLALEIKTTKAPPGSVALWWLAQAGFAFKTGSGEVIYVDAYLSNVVEKAFGFKRLSLSPIDADQVRADVWISSHEHLDHLDTESLPIIARANPGCTFAGSTACEEQYAKLGIPRDRQVILQPERVYRMKGVAIHTAKADHGELSPSALSLLLDFGDTRVLYTGDTALRPDLLQALIDLKPDVLLTCINGRFGNLDSEQAAELTSIVQPRVVIPCHFWMFKEHGGDPQSFVEACESKCPDVRIALLCPGDGVIVTPDNVT